jgi:hypothetical protein
MTMRSRLIVSPALLTADICLSLGNLPDEPNEPGDYRSNRNQDDKRPDLRSASHDGGDDGDGADHPEDDPEQGEFSPRFWITKHLRSCSPSAWPE